MVSINISNVKTTQKKKYIEKRKSYVKSNTNGSCN